MRALSMDYAVTESDDLDLARRHAQGDRSAFDTVYEEYGGMVYGLALRLTGDPEEASDLHQEAFLRIFRSLGSFSGRSSLKTWVYTVTLNAGRTKLKRIGRRPRVVEDDRTLDALADLRADPERRALGRDAGRHLQEALVELPAAFRVAVVLRDVEGLSYDEIAQIVGVRIGTVRSRIARGRDRLRARLEEAR